MVLVGVVGMGERERAILGGVVDALVYVLYFMGLEGGQQEQEQEEHKESIIIRGLLFSPIISIRVYMSVHAVERDGVDLAGGPFVAHRLEVGVPHGALGVFLQTGFHGDEGAFGLAQEGAVLLFRVGVHGHVQTGVRDSLFYITEH